jgi:hypothetical protein
MNTKIVLLSLFLAINTAFFISGCHTRDDVYLTIYLDSGVVGTPTAGSYTYDYQGTVHYSYSLAPGYENLVVTYDDIQIQPKGSVSVMNSHILRATADRVVFDLRGKWTGEHNYLGNDFYFEVTFSGERLSGSTMGTTDQMDDMNGRGTFTVSEDETTITFSLEFSNRTYHFQGTVDSIDQMSGTYYTVPAQWSGNWELHRQI